MTYRILYWTWDNWSGDPKEIELTLDHPPTQDDVERELEQEVQSFRAEPV